MILLWKYIEIKNIFKILGKKINRTETSHVVSVWYLCEYTNSVQIERSHEFGCLKEIASLHRREDLQ